MSRLRPYFDDCVRRARAAGWEVLEERTIPYGRQARMGRPGADDAMLSCYEGKKGLSCVPGGKGAADLARDLGTAAPRAAGGAGLTAGPDPFGLGLPRIGADESGKGDWFGPLVTAAYRLEEGDVEALRALGVNDSKVLADSASARIAGQLDERGGGEVEVLMPLDYNPRYARLRNVNLLLSEMHGACIRRLHERTGPVPVVIVDQFSPRTAVLERDAHLPAGCRLVTRTKGEADLAVAAASILARAAFVDGLRELSNEFGMTLPPGAGTPVLVAGRAFVRTFGRDALAHVAKLHFATSAQV